MAALPGQSLDGDWRVDGCANLSSGHAVVFDCPGDVSRVWIVIRLHGGTCQWGHWAEGQAPSYEPCTLQQGQFCWSLDSGPGGVCAPMKLDAGRMYRCLGDTLCEQYERFAGTP
jgi:hypothetical protein